MRLKSVHIDKYKNLNDFTLSFDGDSFIDVFVGKNGTGKSNLFEALIEIFRHIVESRNQLAETDLSYKIQYEIDGELTKIGWDGSKLSINGAERKTTQSATLPDNVLIYYSGHNDTVRKLVDKYESAFLRRVRRAGPEESRRFLGIDSRYKELLLLVLLIQRANNKAHQYICEKLGITMVGSEFNLELKRPFFADGRFNELDADHVEHFDPRTHFWGADGITKDFLGNLVNCVKGEFHHADVYSPENDTYRIPINIELFQVVFRDEDSHDIFRGFDILKSLEMLGGITLELRLDNGETSSIEHFSDGQFQSIYIYSIVEIFKDRNCITLLDEPDSFLHPEWQFDFLKQVFEITDTATKNNHVLMSSHSASTLCTLEDQSIHLFSVEGPAVSLSKRTKKEIVQTLSGNCIQYSEDESNLLIENVIRSSLRPILFVEGVSDVSILNIAQKMLYPGEDISILVQDAFDRGFIKTLFARPDIFRRYPEKDLFALFDFDDAYEDWRSLGGEYHETNIEKGLCKKLQDKNAHIFLLPIPSNQLKKQVWDDNNPNEKILPTPHFCIEHIFWEVEGLEFWYKEDTKSGMIKFKGDKHKVKFAKEVVPTLSAEAFEPFRPMFDFIRSQST